MLLIGRRIENRQLNIDTGVMEVDIRFTERIGERKEWGVSSQPGLRALGFFKKELYTREHLIEKLEIEMRT